MGGDLAGIAGTVILTGVAAAEFLYFAPRARS
jgi:hypothetical protein